MTETPPHHSASRLLRAIPPTLLACLALLLLLGGVTSGLGWRESANLQIYEFANEEEVCVR